MGNDLGEKIKNDFLPFVQKPAHYIGGEVNSVTKDWDSVALRFCLAFPDTYAIGMSHLGSAIIYGLLNQMPDVLCERSFAPWIDAEAVMRKCGVPIFSLESRRQLKDFDVVGFSLQYEMTHTNVLNMLDLAGIPVLASERREDDPLILGGGPATNNPEPMALFMDLMLVGEAEDVLPQILRRYAELAGEGVSRAERIIDLARRFSCLYAPGLIEPRWNADGTLAALEPTVEGLPERTVKAYVADLENSFFPTATIVPNTEVVHDRVTIEIMRGCPRACRFCEAGFTRGPVRYRSVECIARIAREGYEATGHNEISLVSLSPSDHPKLETILRRLADEFTPLRVNLSMPSLRTNHQLEIVPKLISGVRKSGLTLVPETASPRLRRAIGKDLDEEHLMAGARAAYERGWRRIKLYIMVGLPGETRDDVEAIPDLVHRISMLRKEVANGPGQINLTLASFVPKPHTPLQFVAMKGREYLDEARRTLQIQLPRRQVKLKFHKVERGILEGVLARGDRKVGRAILEAWRAGARFDAWDETFNPEAWAAGLKAAGVDPDFYAHRGRGEDEVLPWDRVDVGAIRKELLAQYHKAMQILEEI